LQFLVPSCPRQASAGHALKTGPAARDELAQALSGLFRATALMIAARLVPTLWCVKAHAPVHHSLETHRIAVDHFDRTGLVRIPGIAARDSD
jgi:hypothetical protein